MAKKKDRKRKKSHKPHNTLQARNLSRSGIECVCLKAPCTINVKKKIPILISQSTGFCAAFNRNAVREIDPSDPALESSMHNEFGGTNPDMSV